MVELRKEADSAAIQRNLQRVSELGEEITRLEKALDESRSHWIESLPPAEISIGDITAVVSEMTGIPISRVGESEMVKLADLEARMAESIIGQDAALGHIAGAIRRSRVGLRSRTRPTGCFLFLGPPGWAKRKPPEYLRSRSSATAAPSSGLTCRNTARVFRFQARGRPPGYVGYDDGGQLTEKVRRKPYSVVLLDEIEKAHSDVYNMLLQVMDYGNMTDNYGRKIDFSNTIIIMTANLTPKGGGGTVGFLRESSEAAGEAVLASARSVFPPEFMNRLDATIVYNPLTFEDVKKIVEIQLMEVNERLSELDIQLSLSSEALDLIAEAGYSGEAGARHLRRTIQRLLEDPLTDMLVSGELTGGCCLETIRNGDRLSFAVRSADKVSNSVTEVNI